MSNIHLEIKDYYNGKVSEFGPTPKGVDWSSEESQSIRYRQLSNIFEEESKFSVLDFGCGYGYSLTWLRKRYQQFEYFGYDISQDMLRHATAIHSQDKGAEFSDSKSVLEKKYDYVLCSGVFNVKLKSSYEAWFEYLIENLHLLNDCSAKGFSFNVLSIYSDPHLRKENLYYADPLVVFDYCKKNFSSRIALLHDYPLYEFTILVRKT